MKIRRSFKDVICLFLLLRTHFFSTLPILSKRLRMTQVAEGGSVMLFASLWCNAYENWYSYDSPLNSLGKIPWIVRYCQNEVDSNYKVHKLLSIFWGVCCCRYYLCYYRYHLVVIKSVRFRFIMKLCTWCKASIYAIN